MKWTVFNILGAMAWLAGLAFAKGTQLPVANVLATGDNQFLVGLLFGAAGLVTLLWINLRSAT